MRAPFLAFAATLVLFAAVPGSRGELLLRAPAAAVPAGGEFTLVLVETNTGDKPLTAHPLRHLPVMAFANGGHAVSAVFVADDGSADSPLPPGSFRTVKLRGRLPAELVGLVVLDATPAGVGRVAVEIVPPEPGPRSLVAAAAVEPGRSEQNAGSAPPPETPTPPSRRDFGLSPHEPMYFAVGGRGGMNARFQLSFKFRPIGPSDDRVAGRIFWENLYVAYTQTSLWDLHSLSKPFTDSSYRPAAFYHRYDTGLEVLGARVGFAGGFEHESNGKAGAESRSINILFARPTLRWGDADAWQFSIAPKLYWYLEKSENDDIQHFRGYGDFLFALEHPRSWKITASLRAGTSGHGSVLLDATYPFSKINDVFPLGWVHGYLHFQLFDGWGESLLHYNERAETEFRVGFMAIR